MTCNIMRNQYYRSWIFLQIAYFSQSNKCQIPQITLKPKNCTNIYNFPILVSSIRLISHPPALSPSSFPLFFFVVFEFIMTIMSNLSKMFGIRKLLPLSMKCLFHCMISTFSVSGSHTSPSTNSKVVNCSFLLSCLYD